MSTASQGSRASWAPPLGAPPTPACPPARTALVPSHGHTVCAPSERPQQPVWFEGSSMTGGGVLTPQPPPRSRRAGKTGRKGDQGIRPPPQPRLSAASPGSSAGLCLQWGRQPPPGALQASVCSGDSSLPRELCRPLSACSLYGLSSGRELTTKEPTSQVLLKNGETSLLQQRLASDLGRGVSGLPSPGMSPSPTFPRPPTETGARPS